MGQSQEQIARIQEILRQMDEHLQSPSSDNRSAPRVNVRTPMTVNFLSGAGASPVDVFTRNLSISGIGFVSRRMFRTEERVAISLKIPKLPAKMILARITFGRYINNGLYETGAEFLECIADARGSGTVPKQWLTSVVYQPKAGEPTAAAPKKAAAKDREEEKAAAATGESAKAAALAESVPAPV